MSAFGGGGVCHLDCAGVAETCIGKLEHIGICAAEGGGDVAFEVGAFNLEIFVHCRILLGGEG